MAKAARLLSYAPYSKFEVGAVILGADGRLFAGANIENASYSLTICAERVALFRAITEGCREFEAIAISPGETEYIFPCGSCLQALSEFAPDLTFLLSKADGKIERFRLKELLPRPFQHP